MGLLPSRKGFTLSFLSQRISVAIHFWLDGLTGKSQEMIPNYSNDAISQVGQKIWSVEDSPKSMLPPRCPNSVFVSFFTNSRRISTLFVRGDELVSVDDSPMFKQVDIPGR